MKYLIALIMVITVAFANPVDELENKYVDVLTKYKVEYDNKCRKVSLAYIKQLEKLQIATVKKGDLDGAVKIKGKIEAMKKLLETHLPAPVAKTDPKEPLSVIGVWRSTNPGLAIIYTFKKDGTVSHANSANSKTSEGTYTISGNILKTQQANGNSNTWRIEKDSIVGIDNKFTFKK